MTETTLAACGCNTQDEWDGIGNRCTVLAVDFFRTVVGFTGSDQAFLEKDASK